MNEPAKTPVRFDQVRFLFNGVAVDEGWLQLQCIRWRGKPDYEKNLGRVSVLRVAPSVFASLDERTRRA